MRPEDSKRLAETMKQTQDRRWHQRVHIIRLSSQGTSVPALTDLFEQCADTIRNAIKRYHHGGLEALQRQDSPGAPIRIPFSKADGEE